MSGIARLGVADIAHRVLVSGLAGLSVYGLYGMYRVHNETMAAGEIAWQKHLAEEQANADAGITTLAPEPTAPNHRF